MSDGATSAAPLDLLPRCQHKRPHKFAPRVVHFNPGFGDHFDMPCYSGGYIKWI